MNFPRQGLRVLAALLAVSALAGSAHAALPTKARQASPFGIARPMRVTDLDSQRRIDVNRINMFVTNMGSFAFDLGASNNGLYFPTGTNRNAVFASGLWFGATVGGETRVTIGEYSQEFGPGIILPGGLPDDPDKDDYLVYKVVRFTGNPDDTAHVTRPEPNPDAYEDPLIHHSWSEYMAGAVPYGAPWKLHRLPDTSTPAEDDSVDVPGPDVLGDMMLWSVYNDADADLHTNMGTEPLNIEVQQTTFGFNRQGALGNTVFLKFVIINKGTEVLQNSFVSLWSDPDLGGAADDLVGSDVDLSLGYVYNATDADQVYADRTPAVGYDFFLGPIGALGDTLPLTSFNKYINGTDPANADEAYNYMQGLLPDGSTLIDPTTGDPTTYFHPGDPVTGTGWLDSNPADRRFLLNSGPFDMAPGDTQVVVGAIIIGEGSSRLSSISGLRFFDTFAQDAFDKNFDLPSPPPQPQVVVDQDEGRVTLCWDAASRLNYNEPGYTFEGYNIYQGASVAGPWTRIETYDEINQLRVIFDEVFDVETGQLLPQYPVAFGSDKGVAFCHTITEDKIRGGSLKEGTEYFFAVTAYSFGADQRPKVLENAQQVIRVIPQSPATGTDPSTASATDVEYVQRDTSKPPTTTVVSVEVVNPAEVTGHTYKVEFEEIPAQFDTIGTDTATVRYTWALIDSTTGEVKFSGQLNQRGDDDYRVVDGIKVTVSGAYFPDFQDARYVNAGPNARAYAGVNLGLEFFGGGAGLGDTFFGSTLNPVTTPDSFTYVELRYDGTQNAYRYLRLETAGGGTPTNGREYRYAGFHQIPFQAWDVINNVQLDVGFVERGVVAADGTLLDASQQVNTFDSTWVLPPDDLDLGGREYVVVYNRPYSDTEKPELAVDGFIASGVAPLLYAMWVHLRSATSVIDPGDRFQFVWANPATDNDEFVFDTSPLVRGNTALAATGLERIRVVPNPYYTRSRYQLSQFNKIVRFINMPENATVRIFNLSGQLVRTIRKTDPNTSILEWDLETDRSLPVGSGVYIYHVDAPGAGSTFGRMVVFMEKERLNNF